jgi:putative ABC transport system permease protein
MIKNYFKIAWRNLINNKLYSFINIIGLSVGIACCLLIFLYVTSELSFDKFHANATDIYRVALQVNETEKQTKGAATSPIFAPTLSSNFPEIKKAVRIKSMKRELSYDNKKFYDFTAFYADSTFFDVFSFPMIEGDARTALVEPFSIVLTQSSAKKYFGNEPAFGKNMKLSDTITVMVKGIIEDVPANSHLKFDYLVSRSTILDLVKNDSAYIQDYENQWLNLEGFTYILIDSKTDYKVLEGKANALVEKEMTDFKRSTGIWFTVFLQPLTDIHLRSQLEYDLKPSTNSDIKYVYIFSGSALLILLIACSNFINLSTARSLNRSKEIGLRKVVGAGRSQLIAQFLGESVIYVLIACAVSFLFVVVSRPYFNNFTSAPLQLSWQILPAYLIVILVVGILAGLYPAMMMSSFAPIKSLKGHIRHSIQDIIFRKGLVIFQFVIAVVLIVGTITIFRQLNYMQDKNIGLNKEQLLQLQMRGADVRKARTLISEFTRNANVVSASWNNFSFKQLPYITLLPEGRPENEITASAVICADDRFLETYGIELLAGRNFSKDFPADNKESFLVNEASVKEFGWKSPREALGKKIEWGGLKSGKVIGVVKNFNYASLHEEIKPAIIHIYPNWQGFITLRVKTGDLANTLAGIEDTWKNITSGSPFKYSFLEEDFASLYKSEQNMRSILGVFTFLSILVACLGLFGLASFTIRQRNKEIGIRVVLGASVANITKLISADFMKLVFISALIALPAGWFIMNKWLQNFAYRIELSWTFFLLAALVAVFTALLTVSVQAIRAAVNKPVSNLRTE